MMVHTLGGCAPTPLAHYLKALGILRLVAEQVDPQARGWWEGERFRLATVLDREALEAFFLEQYQPTPIFNPWGGRSGFYSGPSEKSARAVLTAIERSKDRRFREYRETIKTIRSIVQASTGGIKPKEKEQLIMALRQAVRGKSTLWIDSVSSVVGTGDNVDVFYPALFGTGGNEGSGSYTSAYMAAIEQSLLIRAWDHSVKTVLFGEVTVPGCDWKQSMGQFLPEGSVTPWDFLLAFEGGCVMRSAVVSRNTTNSTKWMSSPFFVAPASYGYASEAQLDEYALNKGKKMPGRGEQWFPLWSQPMCFNEVTQIFIEGRATTKRGRATDGWSMARAITSLGVQRGICEFVRYGYLQRNNQATNFAVPLGRFRVPERISPRLACLDDLDAWLLLLRRYSRTKQAPGRLRIVERSLSDTLFAVTRHPDEILRWQSVLKALADIEGVLRTGTGLRAGPIPRLRPEWVQAADDGSATFRLALACALQAADFPQNRPPSDPVRRHWLPLDGNRFATSGSGSQARIQTDPGMVLAGRKGMDDAVALVQRRLVEAGQGGERRLPLTPARKAAAHPSDLARLLAGEVDLDRTMQLARALMAIDARKWAAAPCTAAFPSDEAHPDDAWLAVRLALLPWPLPDGRTIGADAAIVRRLESGDTPSAVRAALQRLMAAGVKTTVRIAVAGPQTARLWAAALAFPITQQTAAGFLRRLDANSLEEKTA